MTNYPYSKPFLVKANEEITIDLREKLGGLPSIFTRIKSYNEKVKLSYKIGGKWVEHPDEIDTNRWFNIEGLPIEEIKIKNTYSSNTKVYVFAYSTDVVQTSPISVGGA